MTTTLSPAPDATVTAVTADGIRDLPARPTLRETWSQSLAMAWRATKKMRRNPEQWFDVTLQPLLFTAMFAYIFGGAISGSVADYLPILIPGILAQTALTASHGHRHPAARGHGQGRLRPLQVAADRPDRPARGPGDRRPAALRHRRDAHHPHRLPDGLPPRWWLRRACSAGG